MLAPGATLPSTQPDDATPDGLAAAAGGPGETIPPLLRPLLPGAGGIQWTQRGGSAEGLQWRAGIGWRATDAHSLSLDGSDASLPLGDGRAYASVQRRHWGPSWVGSLIIDSAAGDPVARLAQDRSDAVRKPVAGLAWAVDRRCLLRRIELNAARPLNYRLTGDFGSSSNAIRSRICAAVSM
jgi:hypothetical protein